jgi:hypothetical protein
LALVDAGRYVSRKRDDEETARAVAYLRALRRGQGGRRQAGVARSLPDVHAARQLNLHGGNATVEVQARLLAAQSFEEVARITGLPPEVVKWYEALFYQVTDRLRARDWITTCAVGWWASDLSTGRDPATVLRAYAYHGGPALLDAALLYLLGDRMEVRPGYDQFSPEGRLDRSMRLAIRIEMLPWGAKTDRRVFKLHAELTADARKAPSLRPSNAVVARNAVEVLEQVAAEARPLDTGRGHAAGDGVQKPEIRETG